jgi:hypothetical protein
MTKVLINFSSLLILDTLGTLNGVNISRIVAISSLLTFPEYASSSVFYCKHRFSENKYHKHGIFFAK